MQVLAFKVRELLSVQYKCYPSEVLPDRLLTTTAGMGNFLAKVHNVFQTKEDVEHLLGCAADRADTISCVSNDLSQACIASAYSILPSDKELRIGRRRRHRGRKKRGSRGRKKTGTVDPAESPRSLERRRAAHQLGREAEGCHTTHAQTQRMDGSTKERCLGGARKTGWRPAIHQQCQGNNTGTGGHPAIDKQH